MTFFSLMYLRISTTAGSWSDLSGTWMWPNLHNALECSVLDELGTPASFWRCLNAKDRSIGFICNHQSRGSLCFLGCCIEAKDETDCEDHWDRPGVGALSSRARPCVVCMHHDLDGKCVSSCSATSAADGRWDSNFELATSA